MAGISVAVKQWVLTVKKVRQLNTHRISLGSMCTTKVLRGPISTLWSYEPHKQWTRDCRQWLPSFRIVSAVQEDHAMIDTTAESTRTSFNRITSNAISLLSITSILDPTMRVRGRLPEGSRARSLLWTAWNETLGLSSNLS